MQNSPIVILPIFANVSTNMTSSRVPLPDGPKTIQAYIKGTSGTVSCTINWYGSNYSDTTFGELLATMALSGTGVGTLDTSLVADHTGTSIVAEWPYMFAVLSAITGTGAVVTASIGA
jgi:hypothetical protein